LDTVIVGVCNVDMPGGINRDTGWVVELPGPTALAAPLGDVVAAAGELLDAVVEGVRDVDLSAGINRDTEGVVELPGSAARCTPLGARGAGWVGVALRARAVQYPDGRVWRSTRNVLPNCGLRWQGVHDCSYYIATSVRISEYTETAAYS